MSSLYELTGQFEELMDLIEYNEDIDEQTLKDTLEGLEGEIEIKADGYAKVIKEFEAKIDAIKKESDRLSKKRKHYENSIKRMKEALETSMKITGKTKFKTDLFSFNIQKNAPKLVITGDVPREFLIPQPPKVDNNKIKNLLKVEKLDYAHLEQGESLRIR